jgi:RHS repeat-associated protein
MFEAARLTDPIAHTNALTGFLIGAVIGVALIAAVAFATFTCGFGVALLAGLAAGVGASAILALGEAIGRMSSSRAGQISSASPNVFTNSRGAAYVSVSTTVCSHHNPLPLVAEGSSSVFINGLPAARKQDAITCGARIDDGSHNVFIGGGRVAYLPVADEVPAWLRTTVDWAFALAGLVGGLAGLVKAAGGLSRAVLPCAAKFIGGFMIGEAVGRYVAAPVVSRVMGGLFGRPVDVATGRKLLLAQDEVDFVVPGPMPVVLARFYSSGVAAAGALGSGWVLPWEQRLQQRDGQLWLTDAQGRETGFPIVPPGHTLYSEAEQRYLACTRDGRYIMYDLNEIYYDFGHVDVDSGAVGRLQRVEDRSGQGQVFSYDVHGRLRSLHASGGLHLRFHYGDAQPERLAGIERMDADPRMLVRYDYDASGQLVAVVDANGAVARRFTYADGVMTSHTNALGFVSHYAWAAIGGQPRVSACWSSEGEHAEFTYDLAARQTWVRDELGRVAHWIYDEQLQILACTDLDGASYRIDYDAGGAPIRIALPGGRVVAFEYDAAGRIIRETDPLGRTTDTGYDGNSMRVRQLTMAGGARWRFEYDYLGRLLASVDPLERVERYEYAEGLSPLPLVRIDARGGRQSMTWNALGQMTGYTDCSGKTTRYEYDAAGYLASVTDAMGNRTRFEHLPTGEPVRITLPDDSVQEYVYDAAGLVIRQRYGPAEARWLRNPRGQVVEAVDPAQRRLVYRYDARGRLTALATGPETQYAFDYDAGDRLVRELRPDGVERLLRYDAAGALAQLDRLGAQLADSKADSRADSKADSQDRALRTTRFERDGMGRLLAQATATSTVTYAWNDADCLLGARREPTEAGTSLGVSAGAISFDYDKAGRLLAEHGAEGTVRYELDELDNIVALVLPHGQRIDQLSYGSGHVHQIRTGDHVISDFERDDLHREVLRTQGRLTQRMGYDALGRCNWQAAGAAPDGIGSGRGRFWRSYRYDRLGELAEQHDNVRGRIEYHYDPAGHLLRQTRAVEQTQEQFAWDAAGNLLDNSLDASQGMVEGNRLKVWRDIRFEYDPWGNVSRKRKGSRLDQRFTFDAEDRLLAVTTADGQGVVETRFDYDPIGRRIATSEWRRDAVGARPLQRKRFVWQGLRMVQEVRESGISSYVYSPDAMYTPLARVDAVIVGAIAGAAIDKARTRSMVYHFHTDPVGTPLELTDEAGELAWAGKYSAWGKVEGGEDAALMERSEQPLRYPGQYADRGTGLHYNTFRYYDPDVGRFIGQDPIGLSGGENLYAYTPNPTGWMDAWGWIPETAPGYAVYGLYAPGSDKPYYVGITDDLRRRAAEHRTSGRLPQGAKLKPVARNVTYGTARGIEQANIEHFGTKTGTVGFDLQQATTFAERGNKVASYDHGNTTRPRTRQEYFEAAYKKETTKLTAGCG